MAVRPARVLTGDIPEWRGMLRSAVDPTCIEMMEMDFCAEVLAGDGYDLALPFTPGEHRLVRAVPRAVGRTVLPSEEHFRLARDKLAFARWLVDHGFGLNVPAYSPDPVIPPPFMRKGRTGQNGRSCHLSLDGVLPFDAPEGEFYYQQCIPGRTEYATHTVSIGGVVVFMASTESLHTADLFVKGRGESPLYVRACPTVAAREIEAILGALGYTGMACFDYKMRGGIPMFFEMNPRIGYSSHLFADAFLGAALKALKANYASTGAASVRE